MTKRNMVGLLAAVVLSVTAVFGLGACTSETAPEREEPASARQAAKTGPTASPTDEAYPDFPTAGPTITPDETRTATTLSDLASQSVDELNKAPDGMKGLGGLHPPFSLVQFAEIVPADAGNFRGALSAEDVEEGSQTDLAIVLEGIKSGHASYVLLITDRESPGYYFYWQSDHVQDLLDALP